MIVRCCYSAFGFKNVYHQDFIIPNLFRRSPEQAKAYARKQAMKQLAGKPNWRIYWVAIIK